MRSLVLKFFNNNRSLLLVPWLVDFSFFLIIFSVSREMAESDMGMDRMGVVGAIAAASSGMTSLVAGRVSDHLGRRRMIMAGLVLILVCSCIAEQRWYEAAYALGGVGMGMVYPPCIAWMTQGRAAPWARSAMSRILILFCISWNLGMMSGQVSGGWLFAIDPTRPLIVSSLLTTVAMVVVLLNREQPSPSINVQAVPNEVDLAHRMQASTFARLSRVANIGGAFSMSTIFYLFPKTAVEVGIPAGEHGLLLGGIRMVIILMFLLMHLTTFWHFRLMTALGSQCLTAAGMLLLAMAPNLLLIAVALAAAAQVQGYNYFAGLYYSTAGSSDKHRGASSGMHEATISGGIALGSLAGGVIGHHWHSRAPYALAAGVILTGIICQVILSKMILPPRGHVEKEEKAIKGDILPH